MWIELVGTRNEKAKTFYNLMRNFQMYSPVLDVLHITGDQEVIESFLKNKKLRYKKYKKYSEKCRCKE